MFKKLQELLDSGTISAEVANALDGEIGTALKELREEAKSWREKYQTISATYNEVKEAKDALEAKLTDIDKQIEAAKAEGKAELVAQLEATKTEQEALKGNLERIESENKRLKIDSAITEKLTELNPVDLEAVKTLVSLNADLDENGNVKIKVGDEAFDLDTGLTKFKETKATLFAPQGKSGTGSNPQGGGGKAFKRSEMSPEQKVDFIKQNGNDAYLGLPE